MKGTIYSVIKVKDLKNTREGVQKGRHIGKISKKNIEKLLTKTERGGNICKHSVRNTFREQKSQHEKLKKSFKKVLTSGKECDILFRLSRKTG